MAGALHWLESVHSGLLSFSEGCLEFGAATQPLLQTFRGLSTCVSKATKTCCLLSLQKEGGRSKEVL